MRATSTDVRIYCETCRTSLRWRAHKDALVPPFCPSCKARMLAPWSPGYARVQLEIDSEDLVEWLREQRAGHALERGWLLNNLERFAREVGTELGHLARAVHRHTDVVFMFDTDRFGRPLN